MSKHSFEEDQIVRLILDKKTKYKFIAYALDESKCAVSDKRGKEIIVNTNTIEPDEQEDFSLDIEIVSY